MTSFEVNLLDKESKSSRSKAVSHRVRKYLSEMSIVSFLGLNTQTKRA